MGSEAIALYLITAAKFFAIGAIWGSMRARHRFKALLAAQEGK